MTASAIWNDWSCRVRITVTRREALVPAKQHLVALMAEVANAADRFNPHSDVSRINSSAGHLVPVGRRTIALLDAALDAAAETGGAVDPTVGAHVIRAGYDTDIEAIRGQLVSRPGVEHEPPQADWTRIRMDHGLSLAGVPHGFALDLGATAKSWTADVAAHAIAAGFGTGVLVEIGGDVSVAGHKDNPWQVQVCERAGQPGQRVGLTRGGLATSSTIARTWRTASGAAHHVIDPRTGRPSEGPWRTVTVWGPSAVKANTASTAALILGDEAVDYLRESDLSARLIGSQGQVTTVGDWPEARAA
jgi:thiamine biosynthesis lipoprotein